VPVLVESDHRYGDQDHLDGDEQEREQAEQLLRKRGARQTVLGPVEPGRGRDSREDREDDRERRGDWRTPRFQRVTRKANSTYTAM
jgi:hypothetical protein